MLGFTHDTDLAKPALVPLASQMAFSVSPSTGAHLTDKTHLSITRRHRLRMGHACGITDVGLVRRANEDNFLIDEALSLVIIADGMGGHDAGALASTDAITALRDYVHMASSTVDGNADDDADCTVPAAGQIPRTPTPALKLSTAPAMRVDASATVLDAMVFANQRLFSHNVARHNLEGQGMGTTMTGLWQQGDKGPLIVFHVGDTRLYRYRAGRMVALTRDQTLYQRALESGATVNLPARNLLWQAVGPNSSIEPEIRAHQIEAGDIYLLCSDGLHGAVPDSVIENVVRCANPANLEQVCSKLIALAKSYGGRDNITAVMICCDCG